jgi:hypothetical protein
MSEFKTLDADSGSKYLGMMGAGTTGDPFFSIPADFYTEAALGNVTDRVIGLVFGRNPDVNIGTLPEDVWNGGGTYTGQPTSFTPETVTVVSSSTADASAGTGARTIRIFGLKTNTSTAYESEDITLNGTTGVVSSSTWWRVNHIQVLTAGTGLENAGSITCNSTTTTANIFAVMPIGYNSALIAAYTVPFGQTAIIKRFRVSIARLSGAAGSATISFRTRPSGGVYNSKQVFEVTTSTQTEFTNLGGIVLPALTDIKIKVDSLSDNATKVEAAFEYMLIAD